MTAMPSRIVLWVSAAATAAVSALEPADEGLARLVRAEVARFPARVGVYVKHLPSGEEAAVRADEPFNSASVIKLPVMVLAYRLADQQKLDLGRRVEFRKSDVRGGSGVLRYHEPGLNPTLRDLVMQMIITSDNSATDLVIAAVGGVRAVNEWLKSQGYATSRLHSTLYEVFRKRYELFDPSLRTLTPEDVYALQTADPGFATSRARIERLLAELKNKPLQQEWNRRSNEDPQYWLGVMTPRETGRLLESIEQETAASPESCREMKRVLRQQQAGARRLPHYLTVPVGHKTGDLPPVVANDVGIIYGRSGPIVMAVFTMQIAEPYGELEDRIGRLARLVVDYFDGTP
jgi:beta-lactamase class A